MKKIHKNKNKTDTGKGSEEQRAAVNNSGANVIDQQEGRMNNGVLSGNFGIDGEQSKEDGKEEESKEKR